MKKKLERMLKFALQQRARAIDNKRFYSDFKGDKSHKIYMIQLAETEIITFDWIISSLETAMTENSKKKK